MCDTSPKLPCQMMLTALEIKPLLGKCCVFEENLALQTCSQFKLLRKSMFKMYYCKDRQYDVIHLL